MIPNWLTGEYLQPKLRAYYKDDQLKVLKVWAKPATEKGQNYISLMTRIHVDIQKGNGIFQNKTYIVKEALTESVPQAKVFLEYDVYNREMDMYEFMLPKMKQLLLEVGLTGKFTADTIFVDREYSTVILEDLAEYNYVNADRVKQLDLAHTKLTLELLAKFHAASIVVKQRHPELLTKSLYTNFFSRDKKGYTEVYKGILSAFIRFINGQPDLKEKYGDKVEKLHENIMEYGARTYEVGEYELLALNHGDCWTANFMYQYDDASNPKSAIAIDFQFSNFTSPAIDLHLFFTVSVRDEVQDMESVLVEQYYSHLKTNLEHLAYKGKFPSLQDFQKQFESRRFMCLLAHLFKPVIIYDGTEVTSDFSSVYKDTEEGIRFQNAIYANERVLKSATKLLDTLDAKGVLDIQ
ncbi:uncharacterized protein LOC6530850 [Drosophila yakuba]|uniref:CHK kinase-like domain-containing protein n=1 Tax=Drosophila yakuba TaxID=7245 RepID=B4PAQ2_DROYA|nr:uncharacterized protein LOC6530850 [Drosophila yakuba]EDW91443.1 uncharacterized protein Dyak_GE13825 [Drosophila yakuba]